MQQIPKRDSTRTEIIVPEQVEADSSLKLSMIWVRALDRNEIFKMGEEAVRGFSAVCASALVFCAAIYTRTANADAPFPFIRSRP